MAIYDDKIYANKISARLQNIYCLISKKIYKKYEITQEYVSAIIT